MHRDFSQLIRFLSWIFAVSLSVYTLEDADAQAPAGIGIMYLLQSDQAGDPPRDLTNDPSWTNTVVQGVALRTEWGRVEPTEGSFYWGFLDQGITLAAAHGKKISILVTAGVATPKWVYDAGAAVFNVTTQTGVVMPMPLPWDRVFQAKWGDFIHAFAARYGGNSNLAYVVMGGPGRRAESFFCFTKKDINYFTNTLGGLPNWEQGVKWIIDQYATSLPTTPFILDMGSPIPTSAGTASLQSVCNYGAAQYPHNQFGVKSDGLAVNGPTSGSMGAKEVKSLSPTATVGYQFALPQQGATDPATGRLTLDEALQRGIGFGADFIEVYPADCNDPNAAQVLKAAGAQLLSN